MKILNFGSLNIDYVYAMEHFVRAGETEAASRRDIFCGGKGLNQSIALAKACEKSGVQVFHAGCIGADGVFLRDEIAKSGADVRFVRECGDGTGHAIIQVEPTGQNCILLYHGANWHIDEAFADEVLAQFSRGDFLLLQNEISCLPRIIKRASEKGLRIFLNPSPLDSQVFDAPLDLVDCFLLNEIEARDLCGSQSADAKALLDSLAAKFPRAEFVLTLGSKGALFRKGGETLRRGIYDVKVVDTTGAGDTFTGYFVGLQAQGCGDEEALRLASVASSISVSRHGAGRSVPDIAEVRAFSGKEI